MRTVCKTCGALSTSNTPLEDKNCDPDMMPAHWKRRQNIVDMLKAVTPQSEELKEAIGYLSIPRRTLTKGRTTPGEPKEFGPGTSVGATGYSRQGSESP